MDEWYQEDRQIFYKACNLELLKFDGAREYAAEVNIILKEMNSKHQVKGEGFDENMIESYFKVIKLRLSYIKGRSCCEIKPRALIREFGYKNQPELLLRNMEKVINALGLRTYIHSSEPCSISQVSLNETVFFRLNEELSN